MVMESGHRNWPWGTAVLRKGGRFPYLILIRRFFNDVKRGCRIKKNFAWCDASMTEQNLGGDEYDKSDITGSP